MNEPKRHITGERQRISLDGLEVFYSDPSSLRFLYKEIIVERVYNFSPSNSAPFIIDCGCNIGLSLLFFKRAYPSSRVLAFEPNPEAFEIAKANLEANALTGVELRNEAVASIGGFVTLHRNKGTFASDSASTVVGTAESSALQVPSVSLADIIDSAVDVLKLDIEGAEAEVLLSLAQTNKLRYIAEIIMEFHHHRQAGKEMLGPVLVELANHGFGYQLSAVVPAQFRAGEIQNIMIHAYRKVAPPSA